MSISLFIHCFLLWIEVIRIKLGVCGVPIIMLWVWPGSKCFKYLSQCHSSFLLFELVRLPFKSDLLGPQIFVYIKLFPPSFKTRIWCVYSYINTVCGINGFYWIIGLVYETMTIQFYTVASFPSWRWPFVNYDGFKFLVNSATVFKI